MVCVEWKRRRKQKSIIYNLQYNIEVRLIWIEAHFSKVESFIINHHSPQIFEQTIIILIYVCLKRQITQAKKKREKKLNIEYAPDFMDWNEWMKANKRI